MAFNFAYVDHCPKDKKEWEERAETFNCSPFEWLDLSRKRILYHCALTGDGDRLVEVCAPSVHIHGHSCTEFNIWGNLVQESPKKCLDDCPNVYNSTVAYKYQTCYDHASQPNEFNVTSIFESEENESLSQITEVYQSVIVVLVLLSSIIIALAVLYRWRYVIKKTGIGVHDWIRNRCNDAGSPVKTEGACTITKQQSNVLLTANNRDEAVDFEMKEKLCEA